MKKITKLLATAMIFLIASMMHIDSKAEDDTPWIYWDNQDATEFSKIIDYNLGDTIDLTIPSSMDGVKPSNIVLLKFNPGLSEYFTIIASGEYKDNIHVYYEDGYPSLREIKTSDGYFDKKNFAPYEEGVSFYVHSSIPCYIAIASDGNNPAHSVHITSSKPKEIEQIESVSNTPVIIGEETSGYVTAKVKYSDGETRTIYGETGTEIKDVYSNTIVFKIPEDMDNDNTITGVYEIPVSYKSYYEPKNSAPNGSLPNVKLSFINKNDIIKSKNAIDTSQAISVSNEEKLYTLSIFSRKFYMIGFDAVADKANDKKAAKVTVLVNRNGKLYIHSDVILDQKTKIDMLVLEPGKYYFYISSINGNVNCRISEIKADISIEKLKLPTSKSVTVGDSLYLGDELQVTPSYANVKVSWLSSNPEVASVSKFGTVTAKAGGTAKITVNVGGKTASCVVTVNRKNQKIKSFGLKNKSKLVTKISLKERKLKETKKSVELKASSTDSTSKLSYKIKSVYKKKNNGKYGKIKIKKFSISKSKFICKKGLKKGTYKVVIAVKAGQTGTYNQTTANKQLIVTVK